MNTTIDITTILGSDLRSRSAVSDLSLFIRNMHKESVIIDFSNVKFVTRSFTDEFYNTFLKNDSCDIEVTLANVSADIQMVFDAVSHTQHKKKAIGETGSVVIFSNFTEVNSYLSGLLI